MILCPTNSRSGDSFFPTSPVRKIAFHFAPAIQPWALDAAHLYAKTALSKGFTHVVIFTHEDATLENFDIVLAKYPRSIIESGICFISVSAHGDYAFNLSQITFAGRPALSSQNLVDSLSKLTTKSKLLMIFEACNSDRLVEPKNSKLTHFFSLLSGKPQLHFSFPNLNTPEARDLYIDQNGMRSDETIFIDNFNVKKSLPDPTMHVVKLKTLPPTVAHHTDIIIFGCDGYVEAICDGANQRGCVAWPFYEAMKSPTTDVTYESLMKQINNSRPNMTTKWTVTCSRVGKKSDDFYTSVPLT